MPRSIKNDPLPKTIGGCADRLYKIREERYELQRRAKALREIETELKEHIIRDLPKSQASGVAGRVARVQVVKREVPQVKDWSKLHRYIKKHDAFELFQRRLNTSAVQERWTEGEKVPGVESFTALDISIKKV